MEITAVIPIKGFSVAKGRLSPEVAPYDRAVIATVTAGHVIESCIAADLTTLVVTDDAAVADLARDLGADAVPDPGGGLDAAVTAGVAAAGGPWVVLHADLPLLDPGTLFDATRHLATGHWVIAPSRDGGTNLLGGRGIFDFAYGHASFHRHLARIGRRSLPHRILVAAAVAVEIDTPTDLAAAASHPGGRWLLPFLS